MNKALFISLAIVITAGIAVYFVSTNKSNTDDLRSTNEIDNSVSSENNANLDLDTESKPNNPQDSQTTPLNYRKPNRPMEGQDSFGLSICDEVPKTIIEKITGKSIEETENPSTSSDTSCLYFTNKSKYEHILIKVTYLNPENQKKGQEMLGRSITTNSEIPIEHFIAVQENGQINAIYLVMSPNKFVRIDRTPNTADNDQLIEIAKETANIIIG